MFYTARANDWPNYFIWGEPIDGSASRRKEKFGDGKKYLHLSASQGSQEPVKVYFVDPIYSFIINLPFIVNIL